MFTNACFMSLYGTCPHDAQGMNDPLEDAVTAPPLQNVLQGVSSARATEAVRTAHDAVDLCAPTYGC